MYDFIVASACSLALFSNPPQHSSTNFGLDDPCLRTCSVQCGPRLPPKTDHRFRNEAIEVLSKHLPRELIVQQLNHRDACSAYVLPQQEYIKLAELRRRMLSEESLADGEWFFRRYNETLTKLTNKDRFLPFYVLAILRIETDFGRNLGTMPALRAFYEAYPKLRRSKGVREANRLLAAQLVPLVQYAQTLGMDPCTIYGSHSGAIGMPQFMPFSLELARDGDGDGTINLFASTSDAIASIVSFLRNRHWGRDSRTTVLQRYCGEGVYAERYAAIAEEYALALKRRVEVGHH